MLTFEFCNYESQEKGVFFVFCFFFNIVILKNW
jgi:hypothetical protein